MTDDKLLPLPETLRRSGFKLRIEDYARTNIAVRDAEIARLRERAERLEAALRDVLDRDAKGDLECGCININRSTEREYESGRCPHQRARAAIADGESASA